MDTNSRAIALQSEIEARLPDFVKAVRSSADMVMLHQDAFAADYQEEEYVLLGKAIKYAGTLGRDVMITGRNRSTVSSPPAQQASD